MANASKQIDRVITSDPLAGSVNHDFASAFLNPEKLIVLRMDFLAKWVSPSLA